MPHLAPALPAAPDNEGGALRRPEAFSPDPIWTPSALQAVARSRQSLAGSPAPRGGTGCYFAEMSLGTPIPILRIFDEAKAREFYVDFLGFSIDWEHRFEDGLPLYLQVSKGACVLQLTEHHGDSSPGAGLRIPTQGLDALQAELLAKLYRYARPGIELTPWGTRDMSIKDPFGNRLTFTESVA
jgi:catechol 2,3-dioxygenase-like lactoylglutathione lyase family enzyme